MEQRISFIRKLSNLILYSSLWIGVCAAAMVSFTYDVTGHMGLLDAYTGFVFCGTIALYAAHRLTGLEKVRQFTEKGRFTIISAHRSHIIVYGILGAAVAAWFFFHLSWPVIWSLGIPGILSVMYVVPLGGRRRSRDYAMIKIFMISGVWAALTGLIPYIHTGHHDWSGAALIFVERACFIFAITIPFDIRDVNVDAASQVRTIPHVIGVQRAKLLAVVNLVVATVATSALITLHVYAHNLWLPYLSCIVITALLIWFATVDMDDHYYSGLLDGTMVLMPVVYWLVA